MNITVYCGANVGSDPDYAEAARELGAWMASEGHRLVYGSGKDGMMGAVSQTIIDGEGEAVGVTPAFFIEAEETRDDLTELIVTDDMHTRRNKMIELGDAFIALPGGTGTLDEISEVIALKRLGLLGERDKPIMLYNVNGYYDDLLSFFDRMTEKEFCRGSDRNYIIDVRSLEDIRAVLDNAGREDTARNTKYI